MPLGIDSDELYTDGHETLLPGDAVVLYTDGITEARRPGSAELFGLYRLDAVLDECACDPESIIRRTLLSVEAFTKDAPMSDDITILVAKVR
jgi:sigma-B regulation protein RsbU (phosphoserine phosphatase)